jgi:hypothetical protein
MGQSGAQRGGQIRAATDYYYSAVADVLIERPWKATAARSESIDPFFGPGACTGVGLKPLDGLNPAF